MDFTDSNYYKFNKFLLKSMALGPWQSTKERIILYSVLAIPTIPILLALTLKLIKSFDDMDLLTAVVPPFATVCTCYIKLFTFILQSKRLNDLLFEMNNYWKSLCLKMDIEIMKKYANSGRFLSVSYVFFMYQTLAVFILMMFEPVLPDIFSPLNESRPLKTIFPVDYYFFEADDYFLSVTIHMIVASSIVVTALVATDAACIMYVKYICGMFAVVGYRLEYGIYEYFDLKNVSPVKKKKQYFQYITSSVHMHQKALIFSQTLENAFIASYSVQLVIDVICMTVTLVQVVVLLGRLEIIRYVLYTVGQLFHLFCPSYLGQILMDHSINTGIQVYGGNWYAMPVEMQKLIFFITQASTRPCTMTAGKMFIFTLENFSMVVQNCMSFFMVLVSFR